MRSGDVRAPGHFSIARFTASVLVQVAALGVVLRLAAPAFWHGQVGAGVLSFVLCFAGFHLLLAFFEWFFHRYVLHGVLTPWLGRFSQEHRRHHRLTSVRLRPAAGSASRVILNEYPITTPAQFESAAFPAWALLAFWVLFTPLLAGLQLALPGQPVMIAGYAASAFSMFLYEVLHAMHHWPVERWQGLLDHPRFGGAWRLLYGFHLMHHANVGCNEAISGFFGLPIADWCFGTHHRPRHLLLEGRRATAEEFQIRQPRRPIRTLDRWARRRESWLQHRAGPRSRD